MLIRNNAILYLRNGRINATCRLQVVAAEPLVAVHRHVLRRLVPVDDEIVIVRVPYARLRPYAPLVEVEVPAAHTVLLLLLLLIIYILTKFLILPRLAIIRRLATMYAANVLPVLYYVEAML